MKTPIKYTIENIDGRHHVSDSFDVNDNVCMIRIINLSVGKKTDRNSPMLVINKFEINNDIINHIHYFDPSCFCSSVSDYVISKFIHKTKDIRINIDDNSKIEVQIFTGEANEFDNKFFNCDAPTINFNKK